MNPPQPQLASRALPVCLPATEHRRLRSDDWWQRMPAWRDVRREQFLEHHWQTHHSLTRVEQLESLVGEVVEPGFWADVRDGFARAPMAVRLTPYILSLVDWRNPYGDPIRRQFLPLGSEHEANHPMGTLDSLKEQRDAVAPGLTHRYPDKVLFLALDVCPVYCRYCTRSYSIGASTGTVDKRDFRPNLARWQQAFEYVRTHSQVEDVVVSGGDVYLLSPRMLATVGDELLKIPHLRRIRFATKGLAMMPQKILTDEPWLETLTRIVETGRRRGVHVCVHTHFNHPAEITDITRQACDALFQRGIVVRNQSVLLRGVNDDPATMVRLVRRLAFINVQPYYVYVHDMVPGVETLRTTLADAIEIEKQVRGKLAGFMTPTFVCDAFGGGGKRDLHSYEHYDQHLGIAVYRSPVVDPERPFFYFDPLRALAPNIRRAWQSRPMRERMLQQAVERAGMAQLRLDQAL